MRQLRAARSTIIISSIAVIRGNGQFDAYRDALPVEVRPVLLEAIAGTWIPVEAAVEHYRACDALALGVDAQFANGRKTFERTGATLFGTMMRMARGAGVTPWAVLENLQRFWDRGYDGGGVCVYKVGPKEARTDLVGVAVCEVPYYRNALRGLMSVVIELFCAKAYLTEQRPPRGASSMSLRIQWA